MTCVIYWFRNDLRLQDNPALVLACKTATHLLPVFFHDPQFDADTPWGFIRVGAHRRQFLKDTLADLSQQLTALGSGLLELQGRPQDVLPELARQLGAQAIYYETIAAPEEADEVKALQADGLRVTSVWQSSMLDPADLPFKPEQLPDVFTSFRMAVERADIGTAAVIAAPAKLPPLPEMTPELSTYLASLQATLTPVADLVPSKNSSFPYDKPEFAGGERAAQRHLTRYFSANLPHTYKATRNGLTGTDYSSKFSPWLATGALSARSAYAALWQFEERAGVSESSYWLWFELLWRDYFRFLHLKYGVRLYYARGLTPSNHALPRPTHKAGAFKRWCQGETGEPLVDAGMRELNATGYLSNRLRQVVASYLIHELDCDWRAGAAWFESQLLDYDVYSNQGNWLALAGRGTDPRGGRRFNPHKQTQDHDPKGHYRALWL
jgi:deoxyribodipyrimidine photo-lyase